MRLRASLLSIVVLAAFSLPAFAGDPAQARADYERLQKWQFASAAIAITTRVTITRDTATITLTSGNVHLMQPVSSGEETMTQEFPAVPRKVIFAPDHSLLANIKRE